MEILSDTIQEMLENNNQVIQENKYFKINYLPEIRTLLCVSMVEFIPSERFKESFNEMAEFIKRERVDKMIFDKRSLRTFDQASMTWYHIHWKSELKLFGLKSYRKLLPLDKAFRMSVDIGRQKIGREYPDFKFENYDIQYCETLQEAFDQ